MDVEVNLLAEAFKFMALGMSVVFSFLIILFFILKLQHKIIQALFPNTNLSENRNITQKINSKKISAIIGAVEKFKQDNNKNN